MKSDRPNKSSDSTQHNVEIHENREAWCRKPVLRDIYSGFYRAILSRISTEVSGQIVELGSGMGNIKEHIPNCITTDLFENPWLDRCENAYALSFDDGTISNLILFDVWHHLEFPGVALAEARRCLVPGGRLIIFEPDMGWLPRWVYHFCHHEPLSFGEPISWSPPRNFDPAASPYFAAQSRAHRIFVQGEDSEHLAGWNILDVKRLPTFAYLGSGGFSGPQLYPSFAYPALRGLDQLLASFPSAFSARILITLEPKP